MSALHTSSIYPGRTMGPPYCLFCGSDWPCQGSRMEAADRKPKIDPDLHTKLDRIIELLEAPADDEAAATPESRTDQG